MIVEYNKSGQFVIIDISKTINYIGFNNINVEKEVVYGDTIGHIGIPEIFVVSECFRLLHHSIKGNI